MEALKAELATLDQRQKAGVRVNVSDYNAKVDTHNTILERRRRLFAANQSDIRAVDDLATQDPILVNKYNALLTR